MELAGRRSCRDSVRPSTRYKMEHEQEADQSSPNVEHHLHHVCPDNGSHTPFKGVKERQTDDSHNRGNLARAKNDRDDDGYGKDPYSFSKGTEDKESTSSKFSDSGAKPTLHEFIGGKHLTPKILREE